MYGRLTRTKVAPEGIKEAIDTFEERVVTPARKEPGFQGVALLVNRETGEGATIAYGKDREAMEASAERMAKLRESAAAASRAGMQITAVEVGEIVSMERAADPRAGTFARMTTLDAKPEQIDAVIASYRAEVLPLLKSLPGFRSVVLSVNRETGRTALGSVWATEEDRANSEARVADLRKRATATADAPPATVELFEIVYADVPVGARAGS